MRKNTMKITTISATAATLACGLALNGDIIEISQTGFSYSPENGTAAPGDTLRFTWSGGTHTVTTGSNCAAGDFDGFSFDEPLSMANPLVEIVIPNDFTGDIEYFCNIAAHCSSFGMIGFVTVEGGSTPGDFNGDGLVNGGDLGALLAAWGTDNPDIDLSGDGVIDGGDLGIFLSLWTG